MDNAKLKEFHASLLTSAVRGKIRVTMGGVREFKPETVERKPV